MEPQFARALWRAFEPVHAVSYFAPEARAACEPLGLRGFWRMYFATRSAPLGVVAPEVVAATFFGFATPMVARALPSVWEVVTPEQAWAARRDAAEAALERVLGGVDDAHLRNLLTTAEAAVAGCAIGGRPLFAAHLGLAWPGRPLARLWHAVTLLREHRGDGHVAAATAADLDGLELLVLADAAGRVRREDTQPNRGWSDEEWAEAVDRLAGRGLLDGDGRATSAGRHLYDDIEARTDAAALRPWARLGYEPSAAFLDGLALLARRLAATVIPYPNAVGVPPL
jgi:hypothetical protein